MISKFAIDLISDIAGLIGGLLLVKPALRANTFAKQRFKLEQIQLSDKDPEVIHKIREAAAARFAGKIGAWEWTDEWAVVLGILFVILSFGIKIVWAFIMGPEAHAG